MYSASKAALEALSHALRRELMLYGIDVVIVGPGAVRTRMLEAALAPPDAGRWDGTDYGPAIRRFREFNARAFTKVHHKPEAAGEAVFRAATQRSPPARVAPVAGWLFNWFVPRYLMPHRWLDAALRRLLGW